jgi:hypothetical protein
MNLEKKIEKLLKVDEPYSSRPVLRSPLFLAVFAIVFIIAVILIVTSR